MNNQPIGVFDSGVGGISVFKEIKKLLPEENFIYLADQKNFSYGLKSKKELQKIAIKIVKFLVENKAKLVVVACNTVTTQTISVLRKKFKIPIIGIVPVIKTIAKISKTKKVAVFATPVTINSSYLEDLIKKFADNVKVYKVSGIGLEQLIEQGKTDNKEIIKILKKTLSGLKEKEIDTVALGCTHYPLIKAQIGQILGPKIVVVDSGGAVARRTRDVLVKEKLSSKLRLNDLFYTTGNVVKFKKTLKKLLDLDTDKVYNLKL